MPIKMASYVMKLHFMHNGHTVVPTPWNVLTYTHGWESVEPENRHILGFDSIHS